MEVRHPLTAEYRSRLDALGPLTRALLSPETRSASLTRIHGMLAAMIRSEPPPGARLRHDIEHLQARFAMLNPTDKPSYVELARLRVDVAKAWLHADHYPD